MKPALFWVVDEAKLEYGEHSMKYMIRPAPAVDSKDSRSSCGEVASAMIRRISIISGKPKQLLRRRLLSRSLSVLTMPWSRLLKRHGSWKPSCEEWVFEIKQVRSLNGSGIRIMIRWSERIKEALIDTAIRRKFCCPSSFLSLVSV